MATYRLDEQTLEELGLGTLPAEEKRKMLTHILIPERQWFSNRRI